MYLMEPQTFSYRKTLIIGTGFLGISIIWPIFNNFIPLFLQDTFKLTPAMAFFVMTWDNIINVFVQPWAGSKSDHTWNRFGRRKSWILVGMPIAAVAFIFLPLANTVLAIMVFILITNFGMALFRSPTVAWLGDLFPPASRSKANGIINLMGGVGAALALFGGGYLFDKYGRTAPFVGGAIFLVAVSIFAVLAVKEPAHIELEQQAPGASVWENFKTVWNTNQRSGFYVLLAILLWFMAYEGLQTGLSSFSVKTLGLTAGQASQYTTLFAASFILFAVPSGLLGTRIGRRTTINLGLIGLVVLFGAGFLLIQGTTSLSIVLVLGGACWALVNVNSLPLVYDYGDERKIGAYTGLYYLASQSAAILGPVLSGIVVDVLGNEFRWLWAFSALFMAAAWVALQQVRGRSGTGAAA